MGSNCETIKMINFLKKWLFYSMIAPIHIPSGKVVGRSLSEWTTRSTFFSSSATSNSLVKRAFSPICDRALFKISSPIVDIVTNEWTKPPKQRQYRWQKWVTLNMIQSAQIARQEKNCYLFQSLLICVNSTANKRLAYINEFSNFHHKRIQMKCN